MPRTENTAASKSQPTLHSDESLNPAKLDQLRRLTTQQICATFRKRGFDVDTLPSEKIFKTGIG
jgi:hypothetical protein